MAHGVLGLCCWPAWARAESCRAPWSALVAETQFSVTASWATSSKRVGAFLNVLPLLCGRRVVQDWMPEWSRRIKGDVCSPSISSWTALISVAEAVPGLHPGPSPACAGTGILVLDRLALSQSLAVLLGNYCAIIQSVITCSHGIVSIQCTGWKCMEKH